MEDYTNFTTVLSVEEIALLENLINKLAVSGLKQYNTPAATILFKNWYSESDNDDLLKISINSPKMYPVNSIQDIKEDLTFLDDYLMEMEDMVRSKPIVTNLEKIREYIETINKKISKLK